MAQVVIGNNTVGSFLKVFLGASASYLFFYYVVFESGLGVHRLFKFYLTGALFCSGFGIFQLISWFIGFEIGYNLTWILSSWGVIPGGVFGIRISTFFGEPTYYAMFLSGALFVAIHDIIYASKAYFFNRIQSSVVIVGLYISFSGTIVGTIALSILLLALNYGPLRYLLFGIPLAAILLIQVVTSTDEFSGRLQGTFNIFIDAPNRPFNVLDYHGSSVILYNNFFIAKENFKRNFLFGSGLGSHPIAVEKYSLTKDVKIFGFNLNTKDANSMFNRLMSETGLFGLGLFGLLLYRGFHRKNDKLSPEKRELWIISSACFIIIIVNLVRQGHYFLNGFPFYVWLYYKTFIDAQKLAEGSDNS
jgi:hypothetical protein